MFIDKLETSKNNESTFPGSPIANAESPLIKEASIESKQSPILLMHGSKDDVIPISASETTYQILSDMNYKVKFLKYDLGHKIPINKRDQIKNFIKNRDLARST